MSKLQKRLKNKKKVHMGASLLSFCPDWWLKSHHRTLGKDMLWRDRFWDDFYKIVFCWLPLMILIIFWCMNSIFGFYFFIFPFPSVRWWIPSRQWGSKTWWKMNDFWVLKIEKYFGLLTDVFPSVFDDFNWSKHHFSRRFWICCQNGPLFY